MPGTNVDYRRGNSIKYYVIGEYTGYRLEGLRECGSKPQPEEYKRYKEDPVLHILIHMEMKWDYGFAEDIIDRDYEMVRTVEYMHMTAPPRWLRFGVSGIKLTSIFEGEWVNPDEEEMEE
jgi:hypothetical protein